MIFAAHVSLTKDELELSAKLRAHALARSRGQLPEAMDLHDFLARSTVHWNVVAPNPADTTGPQPSSAYLADAVVTWE